MRAIASWALLWALLSLAFRDTECIAKGLPRGPGAALPQSPRIAIIGAGAGGSSAAFWIAKAKERYDLDVVVDIFERSDYVGGRSTTVRPYNDTAYVPVELGASIFVSANKNMGRAVNEFKFSVEPFGQDEPEAIWDGEEIVYTSSNTSAAELLFQQRYGIQSLTIMQGLVQGVVDGFATLYEPNTTHWSSIEEVDNALNFTNIVSQTGAEYLQSYGVSHSFTYELVEAATRVDYAQNVDRIHALGALASYVTDGIVSVRGGNWQIFDQFVNRSGAQLFLKTEVVAIERCSNDIWTIVTKEERRDYDAVIIAAPYHTSHISLPADLSFLIPPQPYIHLHVTLLTTTAAAPNPVYFGEEPGSNIPTTVFTTFEGARRGGIAPEFNSLNYLGKARSATNGSHGGQEADEWVVKLFSMERISDEWLATMFQNQVGWAFRKKWNSYPVLTPTTKFPPMKLDDGLFYVNAFEPFISTMETETISSRNIVDLLLREKFNSSICPLDEGERVNETTAGFVYGWDC